MCVSSRRRLALLCVATTVPIVLGGCGFGAGADSSGPVGLTVTRDFGASPLIELDRARAAPGSDTVMRVLDRNAPVAKRSGGRIVQEIGGVAAGRRGGRSSDWSLYVNGVEEQQGARSMDVHAGDRIWWDDHDQGGAPRVPAVIGSFPEPFVHGREGRRLPVRVECADPASGPCDAVSRKLIQRGVPAGRSSLSHSSADKTLRVLVGPWRQLRGRDAEADELDEGPRASGVFARFDASATRLEVLDERGRPARTLGAGSGLIAATRAGRRQPLWYVTGTDDAGVTAAARAFDESALADRFALAIQHDLPVRVPLTEAAGRKP